MSDLKPAPDDLKSGTLIYYSYRHYSGHSNWQVLKKAIFLRRLHLSDGRALVGALIWVEGNLSASKVPYNSIFVEKNTKEEGI